MDCRGSGVVVESPLLHRANKDRYVDPRIAKSVSPRICVEKDEIDRIRLGDGLRSPVEFDQRD